MSQEYNDDDDAMEDDELGAAFDEAFGDDSDGQDAPDNQDAGRHDPDSMRFMDQANQNMVDDDYDEEDYNPSQQAPGTTLDASIPARPGSPGAAGARQTESAQPAEDVTAKKRQELFNSLTEEQKDRYEAFMRAALPKPKIKKLMQTLLGAVPPEKAVIAMSGICKLHLGEIVETARELASQEGYDGPLLPKHIRRAYQALHTQARVPHFRHPRKKRMLK